MARRGKRLENPITGEVIVFARTAADTAGRVLELDDHWMRPGHRTPAHIHPGMQERWEVVAGTACFRIGGVERMAGPGQVVVAEPGTPHLAWNTGNAPVHLRIEMRPALRWEEFVERLFTLAAHGATDEQGTPHPAVLAALLAEFRAEIAPAPRAGPYAATDTRPSGEEAPSEHSSHRWP